MDLTPTIAVSTMWGAQGRYPDLGDMVDGVRDAGGKRIEINYMPTRQQLEQLLARPDAERSSRWRSRSGDQLSETTRPTSCVRGR